MSAARVASWIRSWGFPVGITAFVIVCVLAGASIFRFLQMNRAISDLNETIYQVNQVQNVVERLETAARGYVLTISPDFLANYNRSRDRLTKEIQDLKPLISQPDLVDKLSILAQSRVAELESLLSRVGEEPPAKLAKSFGLETVTQLRRASRDIERGERALLAEQEAEAASLARVAAVFLALGSGLALFFILSSHRFLQATSREWQAARESALEASRLKSDFLATMSHEIRTPMNGVMGMATLLMNTSMSEEQRSYVKTIKTSADSLLGLINRILDHSKIEAGRLELEFQDFEFKGVFESVLDLLRYWARSKSVELQLDWPADLPQNLWGDPNRLRQVLVNLVSNALKFTDQGFVRVSVSAVFLEAGRYEFMVEVHDSGRGIARDLQSRLFQKFSQVHRSAPAGPTGSGLGLMIARELVAAMGGEIGVESEEGEGSRFWFTFMAEPAKSPRTSGVSRGPSARLLSGHVLIVEDQPINQAVVGKFLESFGLSYSLVKDGYAAVAAVKKRVYDMVLMDCQMQGMNGYEATLEIREWEAGEGRKPIPIVAVTAEGMSADRDRCFSVGMNDFISKPVDIDRLRTILERFLPLASGPEFDQNVLDHLEGYQSGDRPLKDVLVDDFLRSGSEQLQEMEKALNAREEKQFKHLAHALKSTGRTLGLARLGQLCEELERCKLDESTSEKFADLQRAYSRGCDWLNTRGPVLGQV
ncbi:MAG: response regulator [Bdellovibrionales bacterium]|nr:response regulator [Bdellovibrionales bacterium]